MLLIVLLVAMSVYLLIRGGPWHSFVFVMAFAARFAFLVFWMETHKTSSTLDLGQLMFPDERYYIGWFHEKSFHGYGYVIYLLQKIFGTWQIKTINVTVGAFTIYRISKQFDLAYKEDVHLYWVNLILLQHLYYSIFVLRDVIFCLIIAEVFFCYRDYFYTRRIKSVRVIILLSIVVFLLQRKLMFVFGLPLVYIAARRRMAYQMLAVLLVLVIIYLVLPQGIDLALKHKAGLVPLEQRTQVQNSPQVIRTYFTQNFVQVLVFNFNLALNPIHQKDWANRYYSLEFYVTIVALIMAIRRYTANLQTSQLQPIGLMTPLRTLWLEDRYMLILLITPLIFFFTGLCFHYNPRYNLQPQFYCVLLLLLLKTNQNWSYEDTAHLLESQPQNSDNTEGL